MLNLETLLAPLDPQAPCGPSMGQDDRFLELRQEIAQDERPEKGCCSWTRVRRLAQEIFRYSKDLRVAVYLAVAQLEIGGVAQLSLGLQLLSALLERYPDTLHPQARRGKKNGQCQALQCFVEKSSQRLRACKKAKIESDALMQLNALDHACQRALGAAAPSLSELRRELNNQLKKTPAPRGCSAAQTLPLPQKQNTRPEERPGTDQHSELSPAQSSPGNTGPKAPKTAVQNPRPANSPKAKAHLCTSHQPRLPFTVPDACASFPTLDDPRTHLAALRAVGDQGIRLAHALRRADPADPRAYRLLRQSLWLPLRCAPKADAQGQFNLPFLASLQLAQLERQRAQGQWRGLLDACESLLVNHRLSLDLHYLAVVALEGLENTSAARSAIMQEVSALLARMPTLLQVRKPDGSGLATSNCRIWIETHLSATRPAPAREDSDSSQPAWWRKISQLPLIERQARLAQLQIALQSAPDRIAYAKRCLFAAKAWSQEVGLSRLLIHLAHHTLHKSSDLPVQRELESRCLRAILADRGPAPCALALSLAQRDIAAALPFFRVH